MTNGDLLIKSIEESDYFPLNFDELELAVKDKIDIGPYSYVRSGAGGEETLRNNRQAFEKYAIIPRFLNDVSTIDTSIEIFGKTHPTPLLFAPVGMNKIAHEDGERAVIRSASKLGIPYIQSTVASYSMEELAAEAPDHTKWFQLYWSSNKEVAYSMVERAEKAGFEAIVLTIDTVTLGWREHDIRNQFSPLLKGFASGNYKSDPVFMASLKDDSVEAFVEAQIANIYHPQLNWAHVRELKQRTQLPVLLKGVLHPEDARLAIEAGIDGIIVSNHGGRQLDGVIASLDALPTVAEEVAGRIPVIFDSGVYRGIDVLKALALGANAVAIGRPFVYGLAYAGELGVKRAMQNIYNEFEVSMKLAGVSNIAALRNLHLVKK
ncbi:MAG: alpha-hydroxy acid oxidase [Solibacillus sp.]